LYYRAVFKGDGVLLNYDDKVDEYSFYRIVFVNAESVDDAVTLGRTAILGDLRSVALNEIFEAIQISCEECVELPKGEDSINEKYGFMWAPSERNV
jgi:hypothetical protein